MRTSTCADTSTDWNCAREWETGSAITMSTGHTRPLVMPRQRRCIAHPNHMAQNRQVGLEVRPPMAVEKNHPRKREGESGAAASFLLSNISGNRKRRSTKPSTSTKESLLIFSGQWFKNGDKFKQPGVDSCWRGCSRFNDWFRQWFRKESDN